MTTIIVGGGLAGLTAATILARAGEPVTVLEARDGPGGRARTDAIEGALFNLGPHAFYEGGRGLAELARLGLDPAGGTAGAGAYGIDADLVGPLPVGMRSLLRTPLLRGRERFEVGRLLGTLGRVDATALADRSTGAWIEASLAGPRARRLVAGLARVSTYCADLDLLSADVGVSQLQMALGGVRYVHDGWGSVVGSLAAAAVAAGAVVRYGGTVLAVGPVDGGVEVRVDGDALVADAVIIAGPGPDAAARLTGSVDLADWAARQRPVTAACLDLALRSLPDPRHRFAYGLDRPTYFSVHSPPARLGEGNVIHVMRYLEGDGAGEADEVRAELEGVLDRLQPGWRSQVITSRFLRRMVVSNALPTVAGGGAAGRYPGPVADRPGIFVAGDWVGPVGHLHDAAVVSARTAAEAVASRLGGRGAAATAPR